jgi:hypothetical protein
MKKTKQNYKTKSYFKLMLNKLKVMGFYLYLYPFGNLAKETFHGGFHVPTDHGNFLKSF